MPGITRAVAALACAALTLSAPVYPQSNDDEFTPLGSRIKRNRQFPLAPRKAFQPREMTEVNRKRSKAMMSQFSKCLYKRSNEKSLDLLAQTDFGFNNFEQIELETERAMRIYGFSDCLSRVARTNGTGVSLRFYPGGLRQWLLQEAYFDRYPDEATWVTPGNAIGDRTFPLSAGNPWVEATMELGDCVVAADPYSADFHFRTEAGSDDEKRSLDNLLPTLGPCIPDGMSMQIDPNAMRVWLGEALWHASNNNAPAGGGPGLSAPPEVSTGEAE